MPGFVDVTGWSSEDVRRLGHADDYDEPMQYRNPYAYRKPSVKKPSFSYSADKVWAAAVIAHRVNKGYIKATELTVPGQKTNRQIMEELLSEGMELFQEDIEEGRSVRQYFSGLTFKVLEGKVLTPFLRSAMEIASKDTITDNFGVATIASLPASRVDSGGPITKKCMENA